MSNSSGTPQAPLVKRPWLDLNRKVAAVVVLALVLVAIILGLVVVQAVALPEAGRLDELIGTLMTALVGLLGALVTAYATRERER